MNEKTAKIKYLENGTFKEMEVKQIVKQVLDEYYQGYPYEYHSKLVIMDEIGLIETTLKIVKERLNWLLNEIEKEIKKHNKYEQELREKGLYHEALEELGFVSGLNIAKILIKKTFEVIEK